MIQLIIYYLFHIDEKLSVVIQNYGFWSYIVLFLIIFLETGFVITPFLPGDSILFVAGTFASRGFLNAPLLFLLFAGAAIFGDTVNYWLGRKAGNKVFERDNPLINEDYLKRTQLFYEKHGKKTIVLARFIPIIRTFAPFVAGIGKMNYREFIAYNITGGVLWISFFLFGGYFFGNVPLFKEHFSLVIIAIVFISIIPAIVEFWKHRKK